MNDLDLIKMHDDIITLATSITMIAADVKGLTERVNLIQNGEVVDLWNHINRSTQELQVHAGELVNLSNVANGNSVTIDDLRDDINGVNRNLQALTDKISELDHRVRFS